VTFEGHQKFTMPVQRVSHWKWNSCNQTCRRVVYPTRWCVCTCSEKKLFGSQSL